MGGASLGKGKGRDGEGREVMRRGFVAGKIIGQRMLHHASFSNASGALGGGGGEGKGGVTTTQRVSCVFLDSFSLSFFLLLLSSSRLIFSAVRKNRALKEEMRRKGKKADPSYWSVGVVVAAAAARPVETQPMFVRGELWGAHSPRLQNEGGGGVAGGEEWQNQVWRVCPPLPKKKMESKYFIAFSLPQKE